MRSLARCNDNRRAGTAISALRADGKSSTARRRSISIRENFRDKLVARAQIGICPRYISLALHTSCPKMAISFLVAQARIERIFPRTRSATLSISRYRRRGYTDRLSIFYGGAIAVGDKVNEIDRIRDEADATVTLAISKRNGEETARPHARNNPQ